MSSNRKKGLYHHHQTRSFEYLQRVVGLHVISRQDHLRESTLSKITKISSKLKLHYYLQSLEEDRKGIDGHLKYEVN
jgi:hypothetical protein